MTVKGGTRHPEARDVDMQMMSQMERLGSIKPVRKLVYYCQNNNDNTRSLEPLLIQLSLMEDSLHILKMSMGLWN